MLDPRTWLGPGPGAEGPGVRVAVVVVAWLLVL